MDTTSANSCVLPDDATEASRALLGVASDLVRACPVAMGEEIAVTGSVSHGIADEYSDVEMIVYAEELPPASERLAWLQRMGVEGLLFDEGTFAEGSVWSRFRLQNTRFELGWQSFERAEALLASILGAEVIDERLEMASIVESAVALRTTGRIARWQEQLHQYPPALADRLIAEAISRWDPAYFPLDRVAFAVRRDDHWLARQLVWDVDQVMRILCALNHRWEPEPKWLDWLADRLVVKPNDLTGRVRTIFMAPRPLTRVRVALGLIDDTLHLIPEVAAIHRIRQAIRITRTSRGASTT